MLLATVMKDIVAEGTLRLIKNKKYNIIYV